MRWKWWLCPFLIVAGLANSTYWCWCQHRISKEVLFRDDEWPRPWPYPDHWLNRWHTREYDRVRAKGLFPFHGEWDTLRAWMILGHVPSMVIGWPGVILLFAKPRKPPNQSLHHKTGV